MKKTKYGILRVDMLCRQNQKPKIIKHWVQRPDTRPMLFDNAGAAQIFAEEMMKAARMHGIKSGYRARVFTTDAVKDL